MKKIFFIFITMVLAVCMTSNVMAESESYCIAVYEPVCGMVGPECFETASGELICTDEEPRFETFSNSCELSNSKAKFMYEGMCEEEKEEPKVDIWIDDIEINNGEDHEIRDGNDLVIEANIETQGLIKGTRIYSQVNVYKDGRFIDSCGSHGTVDTPVGNDMRANADFSCGVDDFPNTGTYTFEVFTDAQNKIKEYNEGNNKKQITQVVGVQNTALTPELKNRVDAILEKLYKKLDNRYQNNEDKINYLENILERLEDILDKKPQHKLLIHYILNHMSDQIDQYEDDLQDIIDLLN